MTETTELPDPNASGTPEPKSGRGPTRSAVKMADIATDVAAMDREDISKFLGNLTADAKPSDLRAIAKQERANMKTMVANVTSRIDGLEARAALLTRADALDPIHRRLLVAMLERLMADAATEVLRSKE